MGLRWDIGKDEGEPPWKYESLPAVVVSNRLFCLCHICFNLFETTLYIHNCGTKALQVRE